MMTLLTVLFVQSEPLREIEKLRRQIEILQGVNALKLSRDQMKKIVDLAAEPHAEEPTELKKSYEAVRDALAAGKEVSRGEMDELRRLEGETMRPMFERREKLASELEELLTKEQWEAARKIGRHDPSRHVRDMFGQMLDRTREQEFPESVVDFVYERLEEMAEPLGLESADLADESGRIAEAMDAAWDVPDEEYEKKREEILDGIVGGGALGKALKRQEPPKPRGPDPRLLEVFTDPVVVGALKKRLGE